MRHLQFQHHDCNDDREDAVAECFEPVCFHVASGKLCELAKLLISRRTKFLEPVSRCYDVVIAQPMTCPCEADSDVRSRGAQKFNKALSLGCWDDWIFTSCTDPNAYGRKLREIFRNQRDHGTKQNCAAQYFWPEQKHAR